MRIFSDDCSPNQITCKDGQCIGEKHWLCDGNVCPHNKCDDHSDEDKQICGKFPSFAKKILNSPQIYKII